MVTIYREKKGIIGLMYKGATEQGYFTGGRGYNINNCTRRRRLLWKATTHIQGLRMLNVQGGYCTRLLYRGKRIR